MSTFHRGELVRITVLGEVQKILCSLIVGLGLLSSVGKGGSRRGRLEVGEGVPAV